MLSRDEIEKIIRANYRTFTEAKLNTKVLDDNGISNIANTLENLIIEEKVVLLKSFSQSIIDSITALIINGTITKLSPIELSHIINAINQPALNLNENYLE